MTTVYKVEVFNKNGAPSSPVEGSTGSIERIQILNHHDDTGIIVLANGDLRRIIRCTGINALLKDVTEHDKLGRHFSAMAIACRFPFQIVAQHEAFELEEFLDARKAFLAEGCDDYISWCNEYTEKWLGKVADHHFIASRSFFVVLGVESGITTTEASEAPVISAESMQILDQRTQIMFEELRNAGLFPYILNSDETSALLWKQLSPYTSGLHVTKSESSEQLDIDLSEIELLPDCIQANGNYMSTQYLKNLPDEVWFGWFITQLLAQFPFTLSLHVSSLNDHGENLQNNSVKISCYLTTFASSKEFLGPRSDELKRSCSGNLELAENLQKEAWVSTLPIGLDELGSKHETSGQVVGCFWPFFSVSAGESSGMLIGLAVANREPVFISKPSDEGGKILISGKTKSGKSFLAMLMVLRFLCYGCKFTVIDTHGAYKPLSLALGNKLCNYAKIEDRFQLFDAIPFESNAPVTIFDISEVIYEKAGESQLLNIAKYVIQSQKTGAALERCLILDDASKILATLASIQGSSYQEKLLHSPLILVTNELNRAVSTLGLGHLLLNGVSSHFIFKSDSCDLSLLETSLQLFSAELDVLNLSSDDQCLFVGGKERTTFRVLPSPLEYWTCTSRSADKQMLEKKVTEAKTEDASMTDTDAYRLAIYELQKGKKN